MSELVALPTVMVTQDQYDAVLGVFGSVSVFEEWYLRAVRAESQRRNNNDLVRRDNDARLVEEQAFDATLPPSGESDNSLP